MKVLLVTAASSTGTTHVRSFSPHTLSAVGLGRESLGKGHGERLS